MSEGGVSWQFVSERRIQEKPENIGELTQLETEQALAKEAFATLAYQPLEDGAPTDPFASLLAACGPKLDPAEREQLESLSKAHHEGAKLARTIRDRLKAAAEAEAADAKDNEAAPAPASPEARIAKSRS